MTSHVRATFLPLLSLSTMEVVRMSCITDQQDRMAGHAIMLALTALVTFAVFVTFLVIRFLV